MDARLWIRLLGTLRRIQRTSGADPFLTFEELAQECGVSQPVISDYMLDCVRGRILAVEIITFPDRTVQGFRLHKDAAEFLALLG